MSMYTPQAGYMRRISSILVLVNMLFDDIPPQIVHCLKTRRTRCRHLENLIVNAAT